MVGRIFIVRRIIQDIVSVNCPFPVDPHMYLLIKSAFLWKLVIQIVLTWQFECSIAAVYCFLDVVLFVMVIVTSSKRSNVPLQQS